MRIPRIFTAGALASGHPAVLDDNASHHVSKVLRHRVGDTLIVFNGDGFQWQATISAIDKKRVTVDIGERSAPITESPLDVHLGIAVSKGERMDWVLQKTTELGVSAISPLLTARTEFKLSGERLTRKVAHWHQILVSACEQCGRNRLPQLQAPVTLDHWLAHAEADCKLVLHHRDRYSLADAAPASRVLLLIGPEGGLADSEISAAEARGFRSLTLGPRVLRTETAPVAALAVLQAHWGDFR